MIWAVVWLQFNFACSTSNKNFLKRRIFFQNLNDVTSTLLTSQDDDDHPARPGEIPARYPSLYEYHFDLTENVWLPWNRIVPKYEHDPSLKYNQILVPTVDTTRTTWLLKLMVNIKRPVVLVGETGTSKTATIQVKFVDVLLHCALISEKFGMPITVISYYFLSVSYLFCLSFGQK